MHPPENHVCFGRIDGSQLREGANAGQVLVFLVVLETMVHVYTCTYQWYVASRLCHSFLFWNRAHYVH